MSQKFVLFVEDDPADLELTLISLKDVLSPYRVETVSDGVEALDFLLARGKHSGRDAAIKPALVVTDINLPRINGIEFLQRLNAAWGLEAVRALPILVLSSSYEERDRLTTKTLGAARFLRKPVSFAQSQEMIRAITELLAGH